MVGPGLAATGGGYAIVGGAIRAGKQAYCISYLPRNAECLANKAVNLLSEIIAFKMGDICQFIL
ncbi:hypothetical protein PQU95_15370 [Vogesella sp. DC21W]|uniref:Uncharacterized protein n=1 Tax=Vogesella aquatica TaxID=2984206 RepID=A0ABT5J170_9NEIS|nr:hypothetical protein [Vogesella aquatica]MDC7718587.1 hypothetical protein [Vogesella aquatica]